MADLDFTVNANTAGAINSLNQLQRSLGTVTAGLTALVGAISITGLARFGDSVTDLKNKLNLLTDSQAETEAAFKGLAAVAINARSDLGATGDLFFRIARAADQLGISQREAADITESVAKALTASGQSAAEAAGPLLQLGQALQSGRFQGDELRSILEGLPQVAKALADSLGVPVGALKDLGAQGKITGKVFVDAMRQARDSIEQDFARTIPTISQALNQLRTSLSVAFGEFETQTQTGQTFALAIQYMALQIFRLSRNIDAIIGPIMTFVKVAAGLLAFTVVGRVFSVVVGIFARGRAIIATLTATYAALQKNIIALSYSLAGVTSRFERFMIFVRGLLKPLGTLLGYIAAIGTQVGAGVAAFLGIDKLIESIKSLNDPTSEAADEMRAFQDELNKLKEGFSDQAGPALPPYLDPEALAKVTDEIKKIATEYQRQNDELAKRLQFENSLIGVNEQQRQVKQALFDLESNYISTVLQLLDQYAAKSKSSKDEDKAALPEIERAIQAVTDSYASQIDVIRRLTNENFLLAEAERQRLALAEFSIKSQIDANNQLRKIQDDIAKSTMTEIEQKYYDIARSAEDSARSAIEQENSRRRSLGIAAMTAAEEKKYYDAAIENVKKLQDAQRRAYDQSRTFSAGWKRAFKEYVDNATNAAKQAERIFQSFTQGMEDLIVKFAKTGKFEWREFVADMLETLLRSQIQQVMASLFQSLGSMAGQGGILGAIGELFNIGGAQPRGQSPNSPLYVQNVGGGGFGGVPSVGGGGSGGAGPIDRIINIGKDIFGSIGKIFNIGQSKPSVSTPGFGGGGSGNILGSLGTIGSAISSAGSWINKNLFGGFFANGGMLPAGKIGIVGERGPELISGPANITPMTGTNVTYNINAVDARSFKELVASDPSFIYAVTLQGAKAVPGRF